jgi:lysophospholipase L1-like esterase
MGSMLPLGLAALLCGMSASDAVARARAGLPQTAPAVAAPRAVAAPPADRPLPRTDENSRLAHRELLEKRTKGRIDVYVIGDSIARRWGATDYPELLTHWKATFFGWNAANFGWGADRIEHMLWRLEDGELDGVDPKVIVILAGTNNVGSTPGGPVMPEIDRINENLARLADGAKIRFLTVNDGLADAGGRLVDGVMNERDKLHPTLKGYEVWADGLKPILTELLGPPAATDQAPPPTGDPSARKAP